MNATEIRRLIRGCRSAALATALTADAGRPYASLVTVACDIDASPLLLLSDLADHARNIAHDPRASLLFDGTQGFANPQEGPRVSVIGQIERADAPDLRARFLARHPAAVLYADFADFHLYRMRVERAHVVGDFARAAWVKAERLLIDPAVCAAFAAGEATAALDVLNTTDLAEIVRVAATGDDRRDAPADAEAWRAVALDPDGIDLIRGETAARIAFPEPIDAPSLAAGALAALAPSLERQRPAWQAGKSTGDSM